ncbi:MAG: nitroreductase family protein [Candidatus Nezhaarchaeales archaeon]
MSYSPGKLDRGLIDVLRSRRSVRRYLEKRVPIELAFKVLEAGRWAPSAHNAQPWRFIIVVDQDVKVKLAEAMAKAWLSDLERDGVPLEERLRIVSEESIKRFTKSPLLIVACLTMEGMHHYPDERRRRAEYLMAVQSVAAAIQNVLLAAHVEGLGACWVCAPLFCPEAVQEALNTPKDWEPQAIITLGYPAEEPEAPPRLPLNKVSLVL